MKRFLTTTVAGVAAALTLSLAPVHAQDNDYVLNTASTGGTYHPVGTAIAMVATPMATTVPSIPART